MSARLVLGLALLALGGAAISAAASSSRPRPSPPPGPFPPTPKPPPPIPGDVTPIPPAPKDGCSPNPATTPRICVGVDPKVDSMTIVARKVTGDPARFEEILAANASLPVPGCARPFTGKFVYVYEMPDPLTGKAVKTYFYTRPTDEEIAAITATGAQVRFVDVNFEGSPGQILLPRSFWPYLRWDGAGKTWVLGGGSGRVYPPCTTA